MTQSVVVVFDMDGVLVDTLPALYNVYANIMLSLGLPSTQTEFDEFNGPSIREICTTIISRNRLQISLPMLEKQYLTALDQIYETVDLMPGVQELLAWLKSQVIPMALASSAPLKQIKRILERFSLQQTFQIVLSGEQVQFAKPAPDIYLLIRQQFAQARCIAVEDSTNGIISASTAGMEVIPFCSSGQLPDLSHKSFALAHSMDEVRKTLEPIIPKASIICQANHFDLKENPNPITLTLEEELEIASIWRAEVEQKPRLFNGKILAYLRHSVVGEHLLIDVFWSEYRLFLAQLRGMVFPFPLQVIGVSGILLGTEGHGLVAKRGQVTEYPEMWEWVPSGSLSSLEPEWQITQELEEEMSIFQYELQSISPLGLIYDRDHQVFDCCMLLRLKRPLSVESNSSNQEYNKTKTVRLINKKENDSIINIEGKHDLIPSSRMLWQLASQVLKKEHQSKMLLQQNGHFSKDEET